MALFPHVRLAKTKEDECDACVAIDIELLDTNLTKERRAELLAITATHINEAIVQRRAMSAFARA